MDNAIALLDCNNFYTSCERVFDASVKRKPVVVLDYFYFGEFGIAEKREYLEFGKSFSYSLSVMTLKKLILAHFLL